LFKNSSSVVYVYHPLLSLSSTVCDFVHVYWSELSKTMREKFKITLIKILFH
jgi:hypothetical protein